ncbi:MAG TPA: hypothetical protein ENK33_02245, partial [Desulfobacterales bacterium]|nr:hypothetical protein [Desulfobacterales bacterium]
SIICPYYPQAELIRHFLDSSGLEGIKNDTVHKFQGSEREIIIYDISDSYGSPPSYFLRAANPADAGARLLNVALSRAQNKLLIVANSELSSRRRNLIIPLSTS